MQRRFNRVLRWCFGRVIGKGPFPYSRTLRTDFSDKVEDAFMVLTFPIFNLLSLGIFHFIEQLYEWCKLNRKTDFSEDSDNTSERHHHAAIKQWIAKALFYPSNFLANVVSFGMRIIFGFITLFLSLPIIYLIQEISQWVRHYKLRQAKSILAAQNVTSHDGSISRIVKTLGSWCYDVTSLKVDTINVDHLDISGTESVNFSRGGDVAAFKSERKGKTIKIIFGRDRDQRLYTEWLSPYDSRLKALAQLNPELAEDVYGKNSFARNFLMK